MVVGKSAEESVDLFAEDQLTSKENRLRKYLGDLETQPSQFHLQHRRRYQSWFRVKTQVRSRNQRGKNAADAVDQKLAQPSWLAASFPPPQRAHSELREREGHEDTEKYNRQSYHTQERNQRQAVKQFRISQILRGAD